ncbi:UTP--glucose-1-phosphate uridylyltransferase [Peptoniphilus asaccharolyticus DSM 20463]|uniref:UTP--glucose-1-phosphate uridylyltransferase n=1 Tax=Peptoniphilus asaccharolyticus DSM 20463 TaxID=573058 RepID=A0A1W1UWY0_PEPAS|nr:UTP--glucose-1-phosphate uridylyltransferase GalU [Peptoniphilus asaccharolyticus]MBL7575300.1 UTP--glucose-1-phosphate uridylyltransferase GalU [Peptoniphilus asaccharolyticus]SMB85597.1 UTP--glucose-1-phosphate uridylyltransferase [Peptoniphilus asaccharolyticus DSM 20463]
MKIKKAIIPAAGLGTRFLPFTKAVPKEMLPIIDTPNIEYIVREAVEAGIEEILIILGRNKNSIEDYFDSNIELESKLKETEKFEELYRINELNSLAKIHFIRQHRALGLGHAVNCAKSFVSNEPFLLLLGDEIIDLEDNASKSLIEKFNQTGNSVIGLLEVDKDDVSKYGIVKLLNDDIVDMVEKPKVEDAPSNLAIIGRYVITPKIFEILSHTKPGHGGEIQLTDALLELLNYEKILGQKITGKRFDTGSKIGYLKATVEYALKDKELGSEFRNYLLEILKD